MTWWFLNDHLVEKIKFVCIEFNVFIMNLMWNVCVSLRFIDLKFFLFVLICKSFV